MIVIRYRGGLGNQMFQYAFGLAVQRHYAGAEVLADLTHYRLNREHNGFELEDVFKIHVPEADTRQIRRLSPYYVPSSFFDRLPEGMRSLIAGHLQYRILEKKKTGETAGYYKQGYHSAYEPAVFSLDSGQDWYLDGLWQDFRYIDGCRQRVKEAFSFHNTDKYTPQDRKTLEKIKNGNSVGIHVRRGDFVHSKFDICSETYYREAIRLLMKKTENLTFYFFSDDPEYVRNVFADIPNKEIIGHGSANAALDMEMLSACRHAVISNSTFALWSVWLGENAETVIAPRYSIINHGISYNLHVPESWIQLSV